MQGLQVWNEQVAVGVSREGRLAARPVGQEEFKAQVELLEGTLSLGELVPACSLI